jgi:lipopolysaccharide export system protein LptA
MMKDQTKNITFKANVTMENGAIMAESNNFVIDRAQWNVKFRSPSFFSMDELKDKAINDEMGIKIKLMASK